MSVPTIQEMVTEVALRIGLRVTQAPVGSSDMQLQQLVALFNWEISELNKLWRWQETVKQGGFSTSESDDQGKFDGYIVPTAQLYDYIISDTMWDRTARQPILGPKSPLDWQAMKAFGITGPFPTYRIRGNRLLTLPMPAANHDVFFEFVSKQLVLNEDGLTYASKFTDNEQTPVLDPDIIYMGVQWRWKMAKGFPYAEEKAAWNTAATNKAGRGSGNEKLSLAGGNSVMSGRRVGDYTSTSL